MQIGYCGVEGLGKQLQNEYLIDPIDWALARCLVICTTGHVLTHIKGLSLFRDGLFQRNWRMLLTNAFLGTVCVVLSNIAVKLLPLTIWFLIISFLPFTLAAFSYVLFGE